MKGISRRLLILVTVLADVSASGWSARAGAPPHSENAVYAELLSPGVAVAAARPVPLAEPSMADGLSAGAQQAVLAEVAGVAYPLARFCRNSPVAPQVLQMQAFDDERGRGRVVDVWFIAFGKLDALADRELVERALDTSDDEEVASQGRVLGGPQLASRGIGWEAAQAEYESFAHGSIALWKRVEIVATLRSLSSRSGDSVIAAAQIDSRFQDDSEFPNRWRPLAADAANGNAPRPYRGMGMYLKVTQLAEPAGALFCEWHLVFAEPREWFEGANLLGSKLPAIVQSRVRALRRELSQASARGE